MRKLIFGVREFLCVRACVSARVFYIFQLFRNKHLCSDNMPFKFKALTFKVFRIICYQREALTCFRSSVLHLSFCIEPSNRLTNLYNSYKSTKSKFR